MASVVDICNLSLAHLGDSATVSAISPSDGSAQADHCARFYPIARDALLEMHDWNFARRHVVLAETVNTPPGQWGYEYSVPSSAIRVINVIPSEGLETNAQVYLQGTDDVGNRVIWTNVESAECVYTAAVTDTTKFSTMFVNALSWLLASYLAGPITKDPRVKQSMYQLFNVEFGKAAMTNSNANANFPRATPEWIDARGSTSNPYLVDGKITR